MGKDNENLHNQGIVMHYQINVTQGSLPLPQEKPSIPPDATDLTAAIRQLLEVNREQAALLRSMVASQDQANRWRTFLNRWEESLPGLGNTCRKAFPVLEGVFARSIQEITDRLAQEEEDLQEEFCLQEFLDRFGNRITQLATLMNLVGPLAEAAAPKDPSQASL